MNINWSVRVKNLQWWLAVVPAVLLLVQVCAAPFGYEWDFVLLNQQLAAIANAAFGVLALFGIVNDPTVKGAGDSLRALRREKPLTLDEELAGKEG